MINKPENDGKNKALAGIQALLNKANGKAVENPLLENLAEEIINKNKALISDTPISSYAAISENQEYKQPKVFKPSTVKRTIVEDEDYDREPDYNQILQQAKSGGSPENRSLHIQDKMQIYKLLEKTNPEKYKEYLQYKEKLEEEKKNSKPIINENIKKVFEPTYYTEETNIKTPTSKQNNNYDTDIEKAVKSVIKEMCVDSAFEDTILTKLINKQIESNKKIETLENAVKMLMKIVKNK